MIQDSERPVLCGMTSKFCQTNKLIDTSIQNWTSDKSPPGFPAS